MPALTAPALLAARLRANAAGPLVTFYDDATGERTELSAATFANWVAKTANLLVDGLGLGPGDTAGLVLPAHWQTLVVAAGAWEAGLALAPGAAGDVTFTAEDSAAAAPAPGGEEIRLSLRPLGGALVRSDPAATDYAAEIRAYADRFAGPGPSPQSEAYPGVSHAAALAEAGADPGRSLFAAVDDTPTTATDLAAWYLAPLAGGGSTVLCRRPDMSVMSSRSVTENARICTREA